MNMMFLYQLLINILYDEMVEFLRSVFANAINYLRKGIIWVACNVLKKVSSPV